MKKFFAILISATVLASPFAAQAQDWRNGPDRGRHVEKQIDKRVHVNKKVVQKNRWVRGQRIKAADRRRMAEIRDYRRYRLSAPPRGHHWVKVDNNFLLVAITSGIISSIVAAR
ncbi:RcnB family protein [Rhizobium sp. NTR19]|uniref:RcnB family protein n=1 Tax=Neorhizobium turbinariae TaxID=2937795 RepID=A0ABT0IT65_9HYPH|nr:RcnB family protein [Neorhizobium turbinariae]MCK8781057.1 RcnB family protein [Neorhizobium turbinariae]